MKTVVLLKGEKGEKRFDPEPSARAHRRADALSELCGNCPVYILASSCSSEGDRIIVNAAAYYSTSSLRPLPRR